jgi:hypothetical protein
MTTPQTRSAAKNLSEAREAFERLLFPAWLRRYSGHEHRRTRPGTFVHL